MYQKIIIVGNLGNDPEMKYLPSGMAVTSFSVATSRRWNDQATGQPVEETTWFRVSVWGKQAETANQYLAKGRKVLVEGRLIPDGQTGSPRTFTRRDGTVGASFEIHAESLKFLSGRDEGGASGGDVATGGGSVESEEDIPF